MITQEMLAARLETLRLDHKTRLADRDRARLAMEQAQADAHAIHGAIQDCEHWMKQTEKTGETGES